LSLHSACLLVATVTFCGFNMVHTIAQPAGDNNAPAVNYGEFAGERVTAGKYKDYG